MRQDQYFLLFLACRDHRTMCSSKNNLEAILLFLVPGSQNFGEKLLPKGRKNFTNLDF